MKKMKRYKSFFDEATLYAAMRSASDALSKVRDGMRSELFEDLLPFEKRLVCIEENLLSAGISILLMHLSFVQNE